MTEVDWTPIIDWFGYKPRFHDAEVISMDLRRNPEVTVVRIHAFRMNAETDARGYFILDRHALVTFACEDIFDLDFTEWNHQNVLDFLEIVAIDGGQKMTLEGISGIYGYLAAKCISISVEPWPLPTEV